MTKYLKRSTIVYLIIVVPLIIGIFTTHGTPIYPYLNFILYFTILLHVSLTFTLSKLFLRNKEYNDVFLYDLTHVGFYIPYEGGKATLNLWPTAEGEDDGIPKELKLPLFFRDFVLTEPTQEKPFPDRMKAFKSYGYFSLFKLIQNNKSFIDREGKIDRDETRRHSSNKLTQWFLWRTIEAAGKVIKTQKLDLTINPIPYAAYLFRVASTHNNPEDEDIQEKALMFWEQNKSLELAFRLKDYPVDALNQVIDLPESWAGEVAEAFAENNNKEINP